MSSLSISNSEMNGGGYLRKAAILLTPLFFAAVLNNYWIGTLRDDVSGPTEPACIENSFKDVLRRHYACIALGNSRILLGLNPDKLSIPCYNFAFQADSFDVIYYKLLFLEKHAALPRLLILGVDDYQFANLDQTRRRHYAPFFPPEFESDVSQTVPTFLGRALNSFFHPLSNDVFNEYMTTHYSQTLDLSVKYITARLQGRPVQPRFVQKENGQYLVRGVEATAYEHVDRSTTRLPLQVDYFDRALNFARRNHIRVFVVLSPFRKTSLTCYRKDIVQEFVEFVEGKMTGKTTTFLSFADDPAYTIGDFIDGDHLNPAGADKFSASLDERIRKVWRNDAR